VLTHFYPACDAHDLAAAVEAHFTGEVILAEDLLQLPVGLARSR